MRLTEPQRRVLRHVAENGPLTSAFADWPRQILPRHPVRSSLIRAGLISTPNMNRAGSQRWEITEAGRQALAEVKG